MRFICDEMFGSLARWLRMIGYDVLYLKDVTDDVIIDIATKDDRFILTRDKELHRRFPQSLYINENSLENQLRIVIEQLKLENDFRKSRCTSCNGELVMTAKVKVKNLVPPFTFQNHEEFYLCMDCGKIFWDGSHCKNITEFLEKFVK